MSEKKIIVWDLGGTKCAAALVSVALPTEQFHCQKMVQLPLARASSLAELALMIEYEIGIKHRDVDAVCIAAAGIFDGEHLHVEKGYPFAMPFLALAKKDDWPAFAITHDYSAILCASFVDAIAYEELIAGHNQIFERRVAFGIGTGLGVRDGVLFASGDFWIGQSEMGHGGIAEPQKVSKAMLSCHKILLERGFRSFEDILSGPGMLRLHQILNPSSAIKMPEQLSADPEFSKTSRIFAFYLGLFIATLQLTFMPKGGIWLSGGLVHKHPELFKHAEFTEGIEALPAYKEERLSIALRRFINNDAVFIGGAYFALKRL